MFPNYMGRMLITRGETVSNSKETRMRSKQLYRLMKVEKLKILMLYVLFKFVKKTIKYKKGGCRIVIQCHCRSINVLLEMVVHFTVFWKQMEGVGLLSP